MVLRLLLIITLAIPMITITTYFNDEYFKDDLDGGVPCNEYKLPAHWIRPPFNERNDDDNASDNDDDDGDDDGVGGVPCYAYKQAPHWIGQEELGELDRCI